MCRAALADLRKAGGGAIVNIGSVLGLGGAETAGGILRRESGVTGLTKAMALDHAHEKIRVNCVCPSIVETELGMASMANLPNPEEARRKRAAEIPMGRMENPRTWRRWRCICVGRVGLGYRRRDDSGRRADGVLR